MSKCKKLNTFTTRAKAFYAMSQVPIKETGQMPFRVYFCPQHHGFHYTSRAIYKNAERAKHRG